MKELRPITDRYDWESESQRLREKRDKKQFPPVSGELPGVMCVLPMCFNKDGYLMNAFVHVHAFIGAIGVLCLLQKELEADTDLCLNWCIYRETGNGDPVTLLYKDVIHCPKGTRLISSRREIIVNEGWGLEAVYAVLADVVPANQEQAAEYYRAHPEKKFPFPYTKDLDTFKKGYFRLGKRECDLCRVRNISVKEVIPLMVGDSPLTEFSSEDLSEVIVVLSIGQHNRRFGDTFSFCKLFDPDGKCVEKRIEEQLYPSDDSIICRLMGCPSDFTALDTLDFHWRKGTYTYEISLYGSNTIRGTFEVE